MNTSIKGSVSITSTTDNNDCKLVSFNSLFSRYNPNNKINKCKKAKQSIITSLIKNS